MIIRFVLRKNKRDKDKQGVIKCRITVNGKRAMSDFSTFVKVLPSQWNNKAQVILGSSESRVSKPGLSGARGGSHGREMEVDNETLQQIRIDLKELYNDLMRRNQPITADILKDAYIKGHKPAITFLDAFLEFRALLTPPGLYPQLPAVPHGPTKRRKAKQWAESTAESVHYRYENVYWFLDSMNAKNILPDEFDEEMADRLEFYLADFSGNDRIAKHLQLVNQVLKFCVKRNYILQNPLLHYEIHFERPSYPVYLTEEELLRLENYAFQSKALQHAADYFVFNCYTGFAYGDYIRFHPDEHTQMESGEKFIINFRQKTDEPAILPFFSKAQSILNKYNGRLPKMQLQPLNRALKEVAAILSIQKNLTTHVARKTAGMQWLNAGVPTDTVARMLGKSTTRELSRYARMLPKRIAMDTQVLKK